MGVMGSGLSALAGVPGLERIGVSVPVGGRSSVASLTIASLAFFRTGVVAVSFDPSFLLSGVVSFSFSALLRGGVVGASSVTDEAVVPEGSASSDGSDSLILSFAKLQ
jgi:hypothetical protein